MDPAKFCETYGMEVKDFLGCWQYSEKVTKILSVRSSLSITVRLVKKGRGSFELFFPITMLPLKVPKMKVVSTLLKTFLRAAIHALTSCSSIP